MTIIASLLVLLVAALHVWFLVLEMFLWDKPIGLKTFRQSAEKAAQSKTLAANQGLYNGFLAAGLIVGLLRGQAGLDLLFFSLVCVVIAGIYGAISVSKRIFYVQSIPAIAALLLVWLSR